MSSNHFTERISVSATLSEFVVAFVQNSILISVALLVSPFWKLTTSSPPASSWTTEAIVSSCSSGRGQGWEYERNEANKICGELGALTSFTHMLNSRSLRKAGVTDGLSVLEIYKNCERQSPPPPPPSLSYSLKEAFNCTIRLALL